MRGAWQKNTQTSGLAAQPASSMKVMKRTFCLLAMTATIAFPLLSEAANSRPSIQPVKQPVKRKTSSLIQRIRLDYIEAYIEEAATKERLEPALLRAVIRVESNFNHKATSRVGAKGLMQIMPLTAAELGNKKALDHKNPRANILAGSHYLRRMINDFQGDLTKAIAAYNAGPNAVRKFKGIPPYPETQAYVKKVLAQLEEERE
jgi:soluble lytic murein transglycosylase-like protein